jgi:hypothetical protein
MKKIHSLLIVAVLLMITATRAAGQTYTSGQFKYELAMAGGETFAYITGLANSSSTVSVITIPGVIEHTDGKAYYTNIDAGAFKDNYNLTDVTVGYGCRVIFNNAFAYCANLKTLRLPSSITGIWQGIVNGAAQNGLKVYAAMTTIPNTHSGAWMGIPKNKSYFYTFSSEMREKFVWNDEYFNYFGYIWKEEIPQLACDYRNTSGHKNCYIVTKPSTKTTDGEMMLVGTYHEPGTTFEVGVGTSNAELMLPDYKVTGHKTYLTKVMDGAYFETSITSFYSKCSKLQEIGREAFRQCTSLQEVHIEDANARIGNRAFMDCEDLTSVWVKTKIIGDSAFWQCESLNDLTLAEGVIKIEGQSFYGCDALTAVHFPASLVQLIGKWYEYVYGTVGGGAYPYNFCTYGGFHSLPNLKTITVAEGNPYYSAFDNILYYDINSKKQLCFCPCGLDKTPTFPTSLKTINNSAFYNVDYLTTVEIPYGVEEISDAAFVQCKNLRYVKTPSTAEVSPRAVLCCGDKHGCLETVCYANPPYFSSVEDRIQFGNYFYPDNFYVPAGDHQLSTTTGHVAMKRAFDTYNSGQDTDISYGAYDILTDEGIPLLLNKQAKTAKVVYGRFDQDYTAQLSGVINIPSTYTYDGITYTINEIDMHAFEGNKNISVIYVPNTVTSFPGTTRTEYDGAEEDGCQFKGCSKMTIINLSPNITTIPNNCFSGSKVREMQLPYGITDIGYQAFANNTNLEQLYVPSSLKERKSVDQTFINGCTTLSLLYMNTTPDVVQFSGSGYFTNVPQDASIYVPVGQSSAFRNVSGWQHFKTIKPGSNDITINYKYGFTIISLGDGDVPGEAKKVWTHFSNNNDDNISETVSDEWGRKYTVVELADSCLAGQGNSRVFIPKTVRRIGTQAMKGMPNLKFITSKMTTLPELGDNVWEGVNQSDVCLYYPDGMYKAYSTAPQWKNFYMPFAPSTPTAVEHIAVPQQQTQPIYNLQGQRVDSAYKGIVIRNGKKIRQ